MEATANTSGAGPADEVPTDADFGIQEGEAEELQQKWVTWSEDLEENKRLVIDEYEMTSVAGAGVAPPASPLPLAGVRRHRRRVKPLDTAIANASPVFYGWVIAALVAVSALFISPAQVYCVGIVIDAIQAELSLSREQISGLYGMSLLMAAPVIMLEGRAVALISRRVLAALCGLLFCVGCMLLSGVRGQLSLLFVWTLLQVVGPGMLYPCGVSALQQWWKEKLGRVQTAAESSACLLGMVLMPAMLSASSACPESDAGGAYNASASGTLQSLQVAHDMEAHMASACWRDVYLSLGLGMLVPMALLALLLLEGGAVELGFALDSSATARLDERQPPPSPLAAATSAADDDQPPPPLTPTGAGAPPETPRRQGRAPLVPQDTRWRLDEVLGHTSFWLAQVSISLVHAVIAAFLFHRHDLISDIHGGMHMTAATGLHVQVVMGLCAAASTPASLLLRRMEYLVLIALVLTSAGLLVIVHHPTSSGLFGSTVLLGCAFGVTNAYATSLWGYFYGEADVHRIRYTSIAITTAASGLAVWVFALSRNEMMSYAAVMNTCALLSLSLAGLDLLALAPPGLIEAMVQRAPTWEQMLARRQHAGYFSISGQLHRLLCAIDALGRPTRQATTSSRREAGTPNRNQANPIINVIPVEAVGGGADSEKC